MIYPPTRIADCRDAHSALAALCDGLPDAAGAAPPFEETDPARMPPLFRKLLAHQDHMTTALEDHYGQPVELCVLADQLAGDSSAGGPVFPGKVASMTLFPPFRPATN